MCAPVRGELTCSRTGVTRRRTPSAARLAASVAMAALAFAPVASTAQEAPTLVAVPRRPRPPRGAGRRTAAPVPRPMDAAGPAGEALSGAVVVGRPRRLGRGRGRLRDRRRLGHRRVAGEARRRPALGPGARGRSRGSASSSTSRDRVRTMPAERRKARRASSASATPSASPSAIESTPTAATGPSATGPAEQADSSTLVAISLADQSEVWRTPLGATSRSGVTIDGTNAFVGDQDGSVYAVSLRDRRDLMVRADGRARRLGDRCLRRTGGRGRPEHRHGAGRRGRVRRGDGERSWPARRDPGELHRRDRAVGGRRFRSSSVRRDRRVRALDAADGTERWAALALSLFSPATALAFDDQSVFAADIAGGLYRLDAADGGRAWSYHLERGGAPEPAGRLRRLGPAGTGRRPSDRDRRGLRPPRLAERPRPPGWSGRSRSRAMRSSPSRGSRCRPDRVRTRPGWRARSTSPRRPSSTPGPR